MATEGGGGGMVAEVEIPTWVQFLIKTTIRKLRLYKFILVTYSTPFSLKSIVLETVVDRGSG